MGRNPMGWRAGALSGGCQSLRPSLRCHPRALKLLPSKLLFPEIVRTLISNTHMQGRAISVSMGKLAPKSKSAAVGLIRLF